MATRPRKVKYGAADPLLREWLDFVGDITAGYRRLQRPRGGGKAVGALRDEGFARLWPRTRVASRRECVSGLQLFVLKHDLDALDAAIVVAFLLEWLAMQAGVHREIWFTPLFGDGGEAGGLLDMATAFAETSKLVQKGILRRCRGRGDVNLAADAARELLGLPPPPGPDKENVTRGRGDESLWESRAPRVILDDVVLPVATREELEDALYFARNRAQVLAATGLDAVLEKGTGVALLFWGPPGTGKSMAAEAFAAALGKSCCVVRPDAVEDCWWGGTEKNIARLFREAEEQECVLVFDECDSFFSRRPVGGAYQNGIVGRCVNMFLRGVEEGTQVYILTTNRADYLDEALARRLAARVEFGEPDEAARLVLWRRLLPRGHALTETELSSLAGRYRVSGGDIKQAALVAARRAARAERSVTLADVEVALAGFRPVARRMGF